MASQPKVALIHDWLTVPAGSEEVFSEICALYPGVVFSSQIDFERCKFLQPYECRTSFVQKLPLALTKHYLYAPILPYVYSQFDLAEFDVVLSDSHSFAHGVIKRSDALHVNYYHTPARSLWLPEIDPRASRTWLHRVIAKRLKKLDLVASKRPDFVLANSETTAERIRKFYGREVHRVIYPPVKTQQWMDVRHESDDEGYLYWGRLIEYKKVDLLIDAVRETGDKLNIVGAGPQEAELKQRAQGLKNVVFHGRLPDEELKKIMSRSRAVLFAAREDFGIVPVEAMAAGLPVVAYAHGGAGETVTEEYGVQFQSQTVGDLVEAMGRLASLTFESDKLKAHAAKFDVERFRTEYRETIDDLIISRRAQ